MWLLILMGLFCFSYAGERVIIEDRGGYFHVESYKIPDIKKSSQKHYYKKKNKRRRAKYYVSSKRGKVFHRPSCKFAKKIKHKVKYTTRKKALKKGLRPCKICKP
ncbi:Ada metal-binding domain-containing protein [Persephonella sp.]